jgi:hypothetical protein
MMECEIDDPRCCHIPSEGEIAFWKEIFFWKEWIHKRNAENTNFGHRDGGIRVLSTDKRRNGVIT